MRSQPSRHPSNFRNLLYQHRGLLVFGWIVLLGLAGAPASNASGTCKANKLSEPYPRLTVDGTKINGQPGVYDKPGQCLPEPVVIRLEPCDRDEFTFWCCHCDGSTPVNVRNFGDVTSMRWTILGGDRDHSGFFVDTHGDMVQALGSQQQLGNETVVYYPPWKLQPGETRDVVIEIAGDNGPPFQSEKQDDPPLGAACPNPPPNPPPADYNPTLSFLVQVSRDAMTGQYRVRIVPPTTPTCNQISAENLPPCGNPPGNDCGCVGELEIKRGSQLTGIPDGQAQPIEMCEGMLRPMNALLASDFDAYEWKCNTGETCETTQVDGTFRDALNHTWTAIGGNPAGRFVPDGFSESSVFEAKITQQDSVQTAPIQWLLADGSPRWCQGQTGDSRFIDPPVRQEINLRIFKALDLDWDPAAANDANEACLPGPLLCNDCGTRTPLTLTWNNAPPGVQLVIDVYPAGSVRLFDGPGDSANEILSGATLALVSPLVLHAQGAVDGPAMIQIRGVRPGDKLMSIDTVAATVLPFDLDVDSDNDNVLNQPDRDAAEDQAEESSPGKIVAINDDFDEGRMVGNDRQADNATLTVTSVAGAPALDELPPVFRVVGDDTLNTGATITLTSSAASRLRVLAVDATGATVQVPFGTNLVTDHFLTTSPHFAKSWHVEGLEPGRVDLTLTYSKNGSSISDKVRLAVSRVELLDRQVGGNEIVLTDWPPLAAGFQRSARYSLSAGDRLIGQVTAVADVDPASPFSYRLTSASDGAGVSFQLAPTGLAATFRTSAGQELQLATASNAMPPRLHLVDEEVVTYRLFYGAHEVGSTRDVMLDRGEGTGGGINSFYAMADQPILRAQMWQPNGAQLWNNGNLDIPTTVGGNTRLQRLIQQVGNGQAHSGEADLMWIAIHGCEDGSLYNDPIPGLPFAGSLVFDPDTPASGIQAGNWTRDVEWVVLAACYALSDSVPCPPSPAGPNNGCFGGPLNPGPSGVFGQRAWQGSAFQGPRPVHGILGSICPLPAVITPAANTFWTMVRGGASILSSYQVAFGTSNLTWASLVLGPTQNYNYAQDRLFESQRDDTSGGVLGPFNYGRFAGSSTVICGRGAGSEGDEALRWEAGASRARIDLEQLDALPSKLPPWQLLAPYELGFEPEFEHSRFDLETGELLLAGERGFSPQEASTLDAAQAAALAADWLGRALAEHGRGYQVEEATPIEVGTQDADGFESEPVAGGWVVRLRHLADGVPLHLEDATVSISGDAVDAVRLSPRRVLVDQTPSPEPYLAVAAAFDQAAPALREALEIGDSTTLVVLSAELVYAEGRALDEPRVETPNRAVLTYLFRVAKETDDTAASCRTSIWVQVDASSGELLLADIQ